MTVASTTAKVAEAAAPPPYAEQLRQLWFDSVAWVSEHSLQIIIGAAVGTAIVFLLMGARSLGVKLCRSDPFAKPWRNLIGRVLAATHFWFMVTLAAQLVANYAQAPGMVATTIRFAFTIATALQVAIWVRELILGIVEHRAGGDETHTGLGSALGIIRLLVTIVVFTIAILMILDNLGVNVTGLIAGLGIGGIAIGLAAKGIFDDLFSALSILFDKPFRRGDSVKWNTTSGTVEAIGLKSTRVRSVTGEEIVISNTNLLNKELHNLARLDRRRHTLAIGVIYQTPPEVCAAIPAMLKEIVESVDKCNMVRCGMTGFGASSLDYELQFDVHSEVYNVVFDARSDVCVAILRRFNAEGIEFAYPTQTSFTAAPDGKAIMPYPPETTLVQPADCEDGKPARGTRPHAVR